MGRGGVQSATRSALAAALILAASSPAYATAVGTPQIPNTQMPWNAPLQRIADSFQGRTAYAVAIIGFVVAGVGFVIQGEMTGLTKKLVNLTIGIAVLLSVSALIFNFWGLTAAVM